MAREPQKTDSQKAIEEAAKVRDEAKQQEAQASESIREANTEATKSSSSTEPTKTGSPLGPNTEPAPLIIQTDKLLKDANVDPRGDNRPGVIPNQPLQQGIDPVTNLREDLVDKETLTPKAIAAMPGGVMNEPVLGEPLKASEGGGGRKMKMVLDADYWPMQKPEEWSDEDKKNRDYRVASGQTVELPEEEALRLLDRRLAHRADARA